MSVPLVECATGSGFLCNHSMAPVRRYLRITNRSVLECRIYLENPALTSSWLLNERSPALPRIFDSVRPLIIPKLREESENAKGKGRGKKLSRAIKDVVIEGDAAVGAARGLLTDTQMTLRSRSSSRTFRSGTRS